MDARELRSCVCTRVHKSSLEGNRSNSRRSELSRHADGWVRLLLWGDSSLRENWARAVKFAPSISNPWLQASWVQAAGGVQPHSFRVPRSRQLLRLPDEASGAWWLRLAPPRAAAVRVPSARAQFSHAWKRAMNRIDSLSFECGARTVRQTSKARRRLWRSLNGRYPTRAELPL